MLARSGVIAGTMFQGPPVWMQTGRLSRYFSVERAPPRWRFGCKVHIVPR